MSTPRKSPDLGGRQQIMRLPEIREGDRIRVRKDAQNGTHPLAGREITVTGVTCRLVGERGAQWFVHSNGYSVEGPMVEGWRLLCHGGSGK